MKIVSINFMLFCIIFLSLPSFLIAEDKKIEMTSNFNQNWLKSIISIEVIEKNKQDNTEKHMPIGTGFLISSENKHLILVTAKHVIIDEGSGSVITNLAYRLNNKNGNSLLVRDEELRQYAIGSWFLSEDKDLACRFIPYFETSDLLAITKDEFLENESIQAGAPILLLGFPLGLRSEEYALPIARSGIIARVNPEDFIADVNFYPGNSGGPIIYVPTLKVGSGLNSPLLNKEKLIGIAIKYISYIDAAVSLQTMKRRITFEENSGLCIVIPANAIFSFLNREDILKLDKQI